MNVLNLKNKRFLKDIYFYCFNKYNRITLKIKQPNIEAVFVAKTRDE